ncbi:MAG: class I SAM-dependent methyltransferase [Spirochaetia bacterium]|nr:class I SAM-dependent methyltransferase [Spirochaetia bacterium]
MEKQDSLTHSLHTLSNVKNYNRWIYDNIKPYLGKNVLEIGCGIGNILDFFITPGRKITGIDIEESYVNIAVKKYEAVPSVTILKGDGLDLKSSMEGRTFDTVIMLNVLEHIRDDFASVAALKDILEPKGRAVILVPAMKFAFGELDRQLGHYKRYEKTDMALLFEKNGLETEALFYMNSVGSLGWWFNSKLLGCKKIPGVQADIVNGLLVPVLKPLESRIRPGFGQSLIAVGRKK